jgi:hypothetical protein
LAEWPEAWGLLCGDAATGRRPPTLTAQWGLVKDVPEGPTGDDQTTGQVYGAVAPLTGRTHDHVRPTVGTGACAQCLRPLLAGYPRKRLRVSHDRGAQQKGAPVEAIVPHAGERLRLTPQPAYSPELNPQERIWTWLRRVVTPHHGFATLREPSEAIHHCFRSLAGVKAQGCQ